MLLSAYLNTLTAFELKLKKKNFENITVGYLKKSQLGFVCVCTCHINIIFKMINHSLSQCTQRLCVNHLIHDSGNAKNKQQERRRKLFKLSNDFSWAQKLQNVYPTVIICAKAQKAMCISQREFNSILMNLVQLDCAQGNLTSIFVSTFLNKKIKIK